MDVTLSKYGNNSLTGFLRVFPINKVAFRSKFSSIKAPFEAIVTFLLELGGEKLEFSNSSSQFEEMDSFLMVMAHVKIGVLDCDDPVYNLVICNNSDKNIVMKQPIVATIPAEKVARIFIATDSCVGFEFQCESEHVRRIALRKGDICTLFLKPIKAKEIS